MKVLLINGSPNQNGCTYTALEQVAAGLALGGVGSSFFQLGKKPVYGCIDCGKCAKTQRCVFDDAANRCVEELLLADAVVVGSPVYYAGPNGALCAMLDRVFYAAGGLLAG
ncbi:MAG: flavodoxin family protein, partial [Oscillospiraceae bacterium]